MLNARIGMILAGAAIGVLLYNSKKLVKVAKHGIAFVKDKIDVIKYDTDNISESSESEDEDLYDDTLYTDSYNNYADSIGGNLESYEYRTVSVACEELVIIAVKYPNFEAFVETIVNCGDGVYDVVCHTESMARDLTDWLQSHHTETVSCTNCSDSAETDILDSIISDDVINCNKIYAKSVDEVAKEDTEFNKFVDSNNKNDEFEKYLENILSMYRSTRNSK